MEWTGRILAPGLGLVLAAALACHGVLFNGFVAFDDEQYIVNNPLIQQDDLARVTAQAFGTAHQCNYHPLTWISHALDYRLFGLNPAGHHATGLIFHLLNALLLFIALTRMSGSPGRSVAVAALFALHPLHVESYAWASCRKDVLSGFFAFLCLNAYVGYARRPDWLRYAAVALSLALGLLSKQTLVTWPFVLLLLDYWPLRRLMISATGEVAPFPGQTCSLPALMLEKVPLLALVLIASAVIFVVQCSCGAMAPLHEWGIYQRIATALLAYAGYIGKTLLPIDLAVLYPLSRQPSFWRAALALALLVALSLGAFALRRRLPALLVGWLWFLGTLVPVLGLVQIGSQAMADRYTYLPLVGLFIAAVWAVPVPRGRRGGLALGLGLACLAALLCWQTWRQIAVWRDTETLFTHTLAVTRDNYMVHRFLGRRLSVAGRLDEAEAHLRESLRINPRHADACGDLSLLLFNQGRYADAEAVLLQTLRLKPDYFLGRFNLGATLFRQGRLEEALKEFEQAKLLEPDNALVLQNLDTVSAMLGRRP